jgi:hypothetical protein
MWMMISVFGILALINHESWVPYEWGFYLSFLISLIVISAQKIESALYARRIFLYTHFKTDTCVVKILRGGIFLNSFQILKSIMIAFVLAFFFKSFHHLTWVVCILFALLFSLVKYFYVQKLTPLMYDELSDQFAKTMTRWTLMFVQLFFFLSIQLYQPTENLIGLSLAEALKRLHEENHFHLFPSIGVFIQYIELFNDSSLWAFQNMWSHTKLLDEKIVIYILSFWFCISSLFYTWFLLYFYTGLSILIDLEKSNQRMYQLTQRYFGWRK